MDDVPSVVKRRDVRGGPSRVSSARDEVLGAWRRPGSLCEDSREHGLFGSWAPAATSKSPTCGQVKLPHLTAAGRGDDYARGARLATFSAASLSR
jgi:ribosomal protein L32